MKKLLFVLAFAFIGQQAFSQMYIATLATSAGSPQSGCSDNVLVKIDPLGNITYDCISYPTFNYEIETAMAEINIGLNSIINQGYKLIKITDPGGASNDNTGGLITQSSNIIRGTVWYFAIP
tara:strand:+ start:688 stop:1053 length:366 start_codon:yes stop_codon:yes gene_type:complete